MSYLRPISAIEITEVVKKSQFKGFLEVVHSKEEALDFIKSIRSKNPQANHNCFCYMASSPSDTTAWGYSDDGEPKGTAGLPMFQVLKHNHIGNVCIVVTRYFGGIKLGTGGIARAYSSVVSQLISSIDTIEVHPRSKRILIIPFHLIGAIEILLKQQKSIIIEERHWTGVGQEITISIQDTLLTEFYLIISPYEHEVVLRKTG